MRSTSWANGSELVSESTLEVLSDLVYPLASACTKRCSSLVFAASVHGAALIGRVPAVTVAVNCGPCCG